jgi:hypothetical protein
MKPKMKYVHVKGKAAHLVFEFGGDDLARKTLCGQFLPEGGMTIADFPLGRTVCKTCQRVAETRDLDQRYVAACAGAVFGRTLPIIEWEIKHFLDGVVREQYAWDELQELRKKLRAAGLK